MSRLTVEQYKYLLKEIHPNRVKELRGMSHLEAWDVRRTLTRVFGYGGWDQELLSATMAHSSVVQRRKRNKEGLEYGEPYDAFTVVYTVTLRLVIKDRYGFAIAHFDDGAAGDSVNQPSVGDAHDMALKTAISQALKRAAINLGDQFGLSLYNDHSRSPVVNATFVPPADLTAAESDMPINEVGAEPQPQRDDDASPPIGAGLEPRLIQPEQRSEIAQLWRDLGLHTDDRYAKRMEIVRATLGMPGLEDTSSLAEADAQTLIYSLRKRKAQITRQSSKAVTQ